MLSFQAAVGWGRGEDLGILLASGHASLREKDVTAVLGSRMRKIGLYGTTRQSLDIYRLSLPHQKSLHNKKVMELLS